MEFPLTNETVLSIPKFGLGRNVLGVIYMQLREMVFVYNSLCFSSQLNNLKQ